MIHYPNILYSIAINTIHLKITRTARSLKTIQAALIKINALHHHQSLSHEDTFKLKWLRDSLLRNDLVPTSTKIAVTYYLIKRAHAKLDFTIPNHLGFFTLMIVGHDGLLRIAEILKLQWQDVKWLYNNTIELTLHSKMNKSADPETTVLTRYSSLSGVAYLQSYMQQVPWPKRVGPLFQLPDNITTRKIITSFCKEVLNFPNHRHGFSFRGGGATDLYNSSQNPSLVQLAGRWKSEAYLRYCRIDREHIGRIAASHFASYS